MVKLTDYIQGTKHGKEANRLEREAMENPFLQDALDGFDAVQDDHIQAIRQLENKLASSLQPKKRPSSFRWWALSIAACAILFFGIEIVMHQDETTSTEIAGSHVKSAAKPALKQTPPEIAQNTTQKSLKSTVHKNTTAVSVLAKSAQVSDVQGFTENNTAIMKDVEVAEEAPLKSQVSTVSEDVLNNKTDIADIKSISKDKVAGKIIDEKGEPIIGATIRIRGSNTATISDTNGKFELPAPRSENQKLEAASIGYNKQEVPVSTDSNIIRLQPSDLALNEVVVVGYGTRKMKSMTGAVSSTGKATSRFSEREFQEFVKKNKRPVKCENNSGSLKVSFTVGKSGKLRGLILQEPVCKEAENELKRLMNMSPRWTKIDCRIEMNIQF